MRFNDWNIEKITGYVPKTTFYMDFSIAERFGINAILDTYNRAFKEWKNNIEYITELVMVLNWKIWEHYEKNNSLANCYQKLWEKLDSWVLDNKKGEELSYFLNTTD